jgi:hypothetical protein
MPRRRIATWARITCTAPPPITDDEMEVNFDNNDEEEE